MNPLQSHLNSLRRRLRLLVTIRGLCWFFALLLGVGIVTGCLDWRMHLPSLLRALILTVSLSGTILVGYLYLLRPLRRRADNLSLALQLEALYPSLNDSLASTVEFLDQAGTDPYQGSADLRQATIQKTLERIRKYDLREVVRTPGVRTASFFFVASGLLALSLVITYPDRARTAVIRLANPFGGVDWPRKTRLENIQARSRVGRGQAFDIRANVQGVIPEVATLEFQGLSPTSQSGAIRRSQDPRSGILAFRIDRVEQNFRFQIRANDAVSDWYSVTVLPPPILISWQGRASPQVHLRFPLYTGLKEQDLPDGSGNIDAVAGTLAQFRAAVDRPVAQAWIEYRPDQQPLKAVAALGFLAARSALDLSNAIVAGQEIWDRVPVRVHAGGCLLSVEFFPRASGTYALSFLDASGLGNSRLFDVRVWPDPAPQVDLERPSKSRDSLDLLPGADILLEVSARDPQFALRSVSLEYRSKTTLLADYSRPRKIALFDCQKVSQAIPVLLSGLAGSRPGMFAFMSSRLESDFRISRVRIMRKLTLDQFPTGDKKPLVEGDILVLQAVADDFDDVSLEKQPGRSHEIEIRVVGRNTLEKILHHSQKLIQQELLRARKLQTDALSHVIPAEQTLKNTGKLPPREVEHLIQAEQLQRQIRERIGSPREGVRSEIERLLQAMRDNHLPRTGDQDRLKTTASELDRLASEELEQIEPNLTSARKESEATADKSKTPEKSGKNSLSEARIHQEEVEKTLTELLKTLEPWGSLTEGKMEARSLLQEQRKLTEETKSVDSEVPRGNSRQELTPEQKAALDKIAELQNKLKERAEKLLEKMERVGKEEETKNPELARELSTAAQEGRKENLAEEMKAASKNVRENQIGAAGENQQRATKSLEKMVKGLEERREKELDRLRKKMKEAEDQIADLTQKQEELQKKTRVANEESDPAKREQLLRELGREQEELQQEVQEMARELSRMRAERASRSLGSAKGRMERAGQQMQQSQDPDEAQEETLDRLKEAQKELKKAQREVVEELTREKLAKISDQIKLLKQRQEAFVAETGRIQGEVLKEKGWNRSLLISLGRHADDQKELGEEAEGIARGSLAGQKVFARLLTRASEAMKQAADDLIQHREKVQDRPEEANPDPQLATWQRTAVHRLDQMLQALKPEDGMKQQNQEGSEREGQGRSGSEEDIPPLAQLKALRGLQEELNLRTEKFARQHSSREKLSEADERELQVLRKDQQELAEMLEDLSNPDEKGEGKP